MKLLFITQKVDKDDDVLGVYHRWIEELAKKLEKISVICLYRGRVELPNNIRVYSLGKEKHDADMRINANAADNEFNNNQYYVKPRWILRLMYIWKFYRHIWQLRRDYDKVFVHMNPEYAVLGGFFWKLCGKRLFFWYNHPMGSWRARVAVALADVVFHTSPFAFAARYKIPHITSNVPSNKTARSYVRDKNVRQMPVGVDANLFRRIPEIKKKPNSILYLGRLSPIKYVEVLIDAATILHERDLDFTLTIAGEPSKKSEIAYADSLRKQAEPLVKKGKIIFMSGVPNYKTPELYNAHSICVNMTPTGSFDKTIIETMACGSLVIASNKAITDVLPESFRFREKDAKDLARALGAAIELPDEEKQKVGASLRRYVWGRHDLATLINRLSEDLK